jgi:periplasmic divalent cation tolerance protein
MNIVIFITTKNVAQAKKISQALVSEHLIACANIVSGVQSLFWWQGKIDSASEALVIAKTVVSKELLKPLKVFIATRHLKLLPCRSLKVSEHILNG